MRADWNLMIDEILAEALLQVPEVAHPMSGGPGGLPSEHPEHFWAEVLVLPRMYPGANR